MMSWLTTILVSMPIIGYLIMCGVFGQPNPIRWFKGELSDDEFKVMMDLIFNDKNLHINEYRVISTEYDCWIANGYAFFKVNENENFTPYQCILFFRELNKYRVKKETDPLKKKKLADLAFTRKLDSLLDEEDKK